MVRAFRVFRLFRQLKSLGQIIRAINQSLPAVGNAFFLVLLMTSIYAIMVCCLRPFFLENHDLGPTHSPQTPFVVHFVLITSTIADAFVRARKHTHVRAFPLLGLCRV
jgi:hypothetical protein